MIRRYIFCSPPLVNTMILMVHKINYAVVGVNDSEQRPNSKGCILNNVCFNYRNIR